MKNEFSQVMWEKNVQKCIFISQDRGGLGAEAELLVSHAQQYGGQIDRYDFRSKDMVLHFEKG